MSSNDFSQIHSDEAEFEKALTEVEQGLEALKERFSQFKQQHQQQAELRSRLEQVEREWRAKHLPNLEKELEQIKEQIKELELTLESALLTDSDLKRLFWEGLRQGLLGELFWQIVRFGGLGIIIGWVLKSCAGA